MLDFNVFCWSFALAHWLREVESQFSTPIDLRRGRGVCNHFELINHDYMIHCQDFMKSSLLRPYEIAFKNLKT